MKLLWFYIAIILALSDILHRELMWNIFNDFYVLFAGFVNKIVSSPVHGWVVHEALETIFNIVILSLIFLSLKIGVLGGLVHLCIDVTHTTLMRNKNPIVHRTLHFVIESIFFILIYGL